MSSLNSSQFMNLTIFWLFPSSSQCVSQHVPNNTSLYPIHYPQCYPLRTHIIGQIFGLACFYVWSKYIFIFASLQSFKHFVVVMGQPKKLIVKREFWTWMAPTPLITMDHTNIALTKDSSSTFFFGDGPTEETLCKRRILNLDGTDPINHYGWHQHSINKGFFFKVVKNAFYLLSTQELWMHWYEHIWCGINLDD
jgi:hypothetical protein